MMYGINLTQSGDQLHPISLHQLYGAIVQPKERLRDQIAQLRMVRSLDEVQYRQLKTQLPYIVCGVFHPALRKREHFASIQHFILDIDKLDAAGVNRDALVQRLRGSNRVMMGFTSPSGDGLKLLFRLSQPCSDYAMFSAFYKLFASRFAETEGLVGALDSVTSDVTRACFLSHDPHAWYDPLADEVDMATYVTAMNFDKVEQELKKVDRQTAKAPPPPLEPTADVLARIREKLSPRPVRQAPEVVVPPEVDKALEQLADQLGALGIQIVGTQPIQFGRKVQVRAENLNAELNLFFGKRGFTVVATTKRGSSPELAALVKEAMENMLSTINPYS